LRERVETLDDWTLRIAALGMGDGDGAEGKQLMAMGEQVRAYVAAYERALDRAERTLARMIQLGLDAKAIEVRAQAINQAAGASIHGLLVAVLGELGHDVAPGSHAAQVILRHLAPVVAGEVEAGGAA
jgi:ABC-type transporter Mla maintaining outer membrane lipid asymmetry permease subunit MlaE